MISIEEKKDDALVCECCRSEAVAFRDGELGYLCADCFAHALVATRLLRRSGLTSPGRKDRNSGGPCQP